MRKLLMKDGIIPSPLNSFEGCIKRAKRNLIITKRKRSNHSSNHLEIILSDICETFLIAILNSLSFISFIDDFSRYACIFLIAESSEVSKIYKQRSKISLKGKCRNNI